MIKIILVVLTIFSFSSCIKQQTNKIFEQPTPFEQMPEELTGEIISGIGIAESIPDYTILRETAISLAQADLVRKIQTKVQSVTERTMSDIQKYSKKPTTVSNEETIKVVQNISVDTQITPPYFILEHFDKKKKRYYAKILYSYATVERTTKEKIYNQLIQNADKDKIPNFTETVQSLQQEINLLKQKEEIDKNKIQQFIVSQKTKNNLH
jgi:hypothetical protein